MALITLRDITVSFGGPLLLNHISLGIEPGQRIAIVGRNGEGKSTLLKVLEGKLTPDDGDVTRQQGLRVAAMQQEVPRGTDGTVFDVVADGLGNMARLLSDYEHLSQSAHDDRSLAQLGELQEQLDNSGGWQLHNRVLHWLSRLELDAHTRFDSLSGGRKRRVLLARALVNEPDVLLLDEPTNHLDINSIDWLQNFLASWNGTLVFISHDRAFLSALATRIIEVDRGQLFDHPGSFDSYIANREARFGVEDKVNSEFDKRLAQEEVWIRQGIKARRTRNEGRVRALEQMRREHAERRQRSGNVRMAVSAAEKSGKLVLEAEQLHYHIADRTLVQDFSTVIMRGDRIGLIGDNGAGKTTLLRLLLGNVAPVSGTIEHGTKLEIAYFDQLRAQLDESATVFNNVVQGSDFIEVNGSRKHALAYLQDFLFSPQRARTPVKALSGGERNRLLLAKLFTRPSNLLVMDEPTNDLDLETLELLEELLAQYTGTLLLISHDRAFLDNVVTQIWAFDGKGRIDEYVGGYQDWLRQRLAGVQLSTSTAASTSTTSSKPGSNNAPKSTEKRKLGYKEQRELEQIPVQIDALEKEQATLQARLNDAAYFVRDAKAAARDAERLTGIDDELLELLERWEALGG